MFGTNAKMRNTFATWFMSTSLPFAVAGFMYVSQAAVFLDFALAYLASIVCVAAVIDFRTHRIPNFVTYTAAGYGLVINLGASAFKTSPSWLGAIGITQSLYGFFTLFGIMLIIHIITGVGAGDVKLAAALGALLGPERGILLLCYTYIIAAVCSLCIAILKYGPWRLFLMGRDAVLSIFVFRQRPVQGKESHEVLEMSIPLGLYFALAMPLTIMDLPQRLAGN